MAIVVEVGSSSNPVMAGVAGALKGAADYARGKKDAEKEREEKERREAEDRRAQEAHEARMAQAELDLERGRVERERENQRWERQAGEGGTWEREDRQWEQEQGRLKSDRRWTEAQRRREMEGWQQSDEDRERDRNWEDQQRDYWQEQRGWAQQSERERREDRERRNRGLDRLERAAEQAEAAEPGEAQSYLRGLRASPITSRYTDEDWARIERQIRVGGLDAGRKEVQQLNDIIRSQMDDEAAARLRTDPTNVTTGALDQALNTELISPEDYQRAQESLAAWENMTPEERAQARKSGAFMSPDAMLVGLIARQRSKRKMKARAKEWSESFAQGEAVFEDTMAAFAADPEYRPDELTDEQNEALMEAREILGELEEAAESGQPGTGNPRALLGKLKRALMSAKPLNEVQSKRFQEQQAENDALQDENRKLRKELEAARAAAPASAPAPTAAYGTRPDGTPKGSGWKGEIEMTDGSGRVITEMSMTVSAGDVGTTGDDVLIPMIVPTLTQAEVDHLASGGEPTETIQRKAVAHAKARLKKGESVWKEDAAPAATPEPDTAKSKPVKEMTREAFKALPEDADKDRFDSLEAWVEHMRSVLREYGKPAPTEVDDVLRAYEALRDEAEALHKAHVKKEDEKLRGAYEGADDFAGGTVGWQ